MLHELVTQKKYLEMMQKLVKTVNGEAEYYGLNEQGEDDNTPIHLAARDGDERMIEILLAAGAKLNIKNKEGKFAKDMNADEKSKQKLVNAELAIAAWHGDEKTVEELVRAGRDPADYVHIRFLKSNNREETEITNALEYAQYRNRFRDRTAIITCLTSVNAAWKHRKNKDGLCEAITDKDQDAVRGLVLYFNHRIDSQFSGSGYNRMRFHDTPTPLSFAVSNGHALVVKQLLDLGAAKDTFAIKAAQASQDKEIRALFSVKEESKDEPKETRLASETPATTSAAANLTKEQLYRNAQILVAVAQACNQYHFNDGTLGSNNNNHGAEQKSQPLANEVLPSAERPQFIPSLGTALMLLAAASAVGVHYLYATAPHEPLDTADAVTTGEEKISKEITLENSRKKHLTALIKNFIGNNNCIICMLPNNVCSIEFKPVQPRDQLLKYARQLTDKGIKTRIEKEHSMLDGLITVPAKLELEGTMYTLIGKLTPASTHQPSIIPVNHVL